MIYVYKIYKKAQTFAIRCTVHHKPHRNMGNLRPIRGSPNNLCLLVASTVVIVQLLSFMSLHSLRNAIAKIVKKVQCGCMEDGKMMNSEAFF